MPLALEMTPYTTGPRDRNDTSFRQMAQLKPFGLLSLRRLTNNRGTGWLVIAFVSTCAQSASWPFLRLDSNGSKKRPGSLASIPLDFSNWDSSSNSKMRTNNNSRNELTQNKHRMYKQIIKKTTTRQTDEATNVTRKETKNTKLQH